MGDLASGGFLPGGRRQAEYESPIMGNLANVSNTKAPKP